MSRLHHDPARGGYSSIRHDSGFNGYAFRWHESSDPSVYACGTSKPTLDEGKPATLNRCFDAVCDDFGTLVEVAS